jgi:hypothetical protein
MPVDERRVRGKQLEEIIDRTAPPGEVIYEAVYAEGEHELERNSLELAFSGLAAGSFYLVSTGALGFLEFDWLGRSGCARRIFRGGRGI